MIGKDMNDSLNLKRTLVVPNGPGAGLGVTVFGAAGGIPVVYAHGFGSSRLEAALFASQITDLNLQLIAIDRPGHGLSSYAYGRRLIDWADDVARVVDQLGVGQFYLLGISGGGPYALAAAAGLGERVLGAAVVAGLGSLADPDLLAAMAWPARISFGLSGASHRLARLFWGDLLGTCLSRRPDLLLRLLSVAVPGVDRRLLGQAHVRRLFLEALTEGIRQGVKGVLRDLELHTSAWGFQPEMISTPVSIWHGTVDRTVPPSHSDWLGGRMPGARLSLVEGEGHFSLPLQCADAILTDLIEGV